MVDERSRQPGPSLYELILQPDKDALDRYQRNFQVVAALLAESRNYHRQIAEHGVVINELPQIYLLDNQQSRDLVAAGEATLHGRVFQQAFLAYRR